VQLARCLALCGCQTWCHTSREKYRLRVFEKREIKIFEPNRGEITGELRKLHNELYDWILFG